ncbi:hypothetical protein Psed_0029 [Pseudonocardia dioxanivorans CB1190]|uniref:Uncharacterized protein n=1 Tax=Pseudonocardia dioxanivorans (strain ATCC 55486 / DSM 44775 / JCM 13855 / CB1190) TaxID=675635 RepID=F4CK88_PSEUX|nr:hypothetical protein [Pseudonocardia dioxanivorans]AEA22311.1 hypothetical protein Psed_0029 [Pseudonocardia dioxanivorans CB1190]
MDWPLSNDTHYDSDDRPEAVREVAAGAKAWRAAVHAQRTADPDHADFYAMTADLVDTLAAVAGLAEVLAWQVARYGDTRPVYDDSGVVDPRERLDAAALDLHELAACVRSADRVANTFWSRIGHIGVHDEPTDQQVATGEVVEVSR